ncbi:hypothetical protein BKA60DRAFT_517511 [Fusarium oxysporum]|nr:hypothetical protein BKA60DRAFT_517511 [Fusarium oxysporum]
MSFVYDSTIIHSDSAYVTQGSLDHEARSLCSLVEEQRSSTDSSSRPIILVAHSLGGLVCATPIILGDRNAQGDDVEAVARDVAGMVFLGTPFAGSNAAKWRELVRKIFNVVKKTDQNTLKTLKENSHDHKNLERLSRKLLGSVTAMLKAKSRLSFSLRLWILEIFELLRISLPRIPVLARRHPSERTISVSTSSSLAITKAIKL